jgi:AcrR family transcriptional regulator
VSRTKVSKAEVLPPRERLLAAANELFYEEGVHTVGIDRILERASVAKASLYSTFGSKEELVCQYLEGRAVRRRERITRRIAAFEAPRDKILAIFELMGEIVVEPTFRGCAFVNASVGEPKADTKVRRVAADSRAWLRALFVQLAREAWAADPEQTGNGLALLYDGGVVGASMSDTPLAVAKQARAMAETFLDAALSPRR